MTVIGGPKRSREQSTEQLQADADGRVPPCDLDAERSTLSAMMVDPTAADRVPWLSPEMMYSEAHRQILTAIQTLAKAGKPTDSVMVATELRERDRLSQVGGMPYLVTTLMAAPAVANVEHYARAVWNTWRERQAILLCQRYAALGYLDHGNAEGYISALEREVLSLRDGTSARKHEKLGAVLHRVYQQVADNSDAGRLPGLPTGFRDVDDHLLGLRPKTLGIIAARPGMGKSAFMSAVARNVAGRMPELFGDSHAYHGVGIFSLEMTREEFGERMMSSEGRISYTSIRRQQLSADEWHAFAGAGNRLQTLPILVDDEPGIDLETLRAKIRQMRSEMEREGFTAGAPTVLRGVFIDYLQLLKARGDAIRTREQEVAEIARTLKEIAKSENIWVIALAQLNRLVDSRSGADRRPQLRDLRESGEIENAGDWIGFLHREGYYDPGADKPGEEGRTELILAKNRAGPTGTAAIRFIKQHVRFEEI